MISWLWRFRTTCSLLPSILTLLFPFQCFKILVTISSPLWPWHRFQLSPFYVNHIKNRRHIETSRLAVHMSTIYTNQYRNLTFAHHLSLCISMVRASHWRSEGYGLDSRQELRTFFSENSLRACVLRIYPNQNEFLSDLRMLDIKFPCLRSQVINEFGNVMVSYSLLIII